MDTHPTLRLRLQALQPKDDSDRLEAPAELAGPSAASAWFGALAERLRDEQQRQWAERVAEPWGERHAQWQQRRARLQELTALPAPDVNEQLELLRLLADFEPERDPVDGFAAFNAQHADHALALFLEATHRLDRGDEQGLALLDRVMVLDPDAIKPCCERAFGHLSARDDPRAEAYQKRWLERDTWERTRQHQIDTIDLKDTLVDPALDADTRARVLALIEPHAGAIAHAWIARRVIGADAGAECYVLGVQATLWTRLRRKDKALIQALARSEWPLEMHVCLLADYYKPLLRGFKALPGAQLR